MTWDATDNQYSGNENEACMVGFSGGSESKKIVEMGEKERTDHLMRSMERLFPGYMSQVKKTYFVNWPKDPWASASYSFPSPGQVTLMGPLMASSHMEGSLHIAGEHSCYKFVGFMEGALQSGAKVARTIAKRDGIIH